MSRTVDDLRAAALAVLTEARDRGRRIEAAADALAAEIEMSTTHEAIETTIERAMERLEQIGADATARELAVATDPDPEVSCAAARTIATALGYRPAAEAERAEASRQIELALDGGDDGQP